MIILDQFPMPPQSNNQYTVARGRLVPSRELTDYKRRCEGWAFVNNMAIREAVGVMICWASIAVHAYVGFESSRIFKKDGGHKNIDVSNRVKALHDAIVRGIGIDDRSFFSISAHKAVADPAGESVIVVLVPGPQTASIAQIRTKLYEQFEVAS